MFDGEPVRGFRAAAAAVAPTAVPLFTANGDARTLGAQEFFFLTNGRITASEAATVTLLFDNDAGGDADAAEVVVQVVFAAAGTHEFECEMECARGKRGITISILTTAGSVGASFSGRIKVA